MDLFLEAAEFTVVSGLSPVNCCRAQRVFPHCLLLPQTVPSGGVARPCRHCPGPTNGTHQLGFLSLHSRSRVV